MQQSIAYSPMIDFWTVHMENNLLKETYPLNVISESRGD